jgi:hypothetical protein
MDRIAGAPQRGEAVNVPVHSQQGPLRRIDSPMLSNGLATCLMAEIAIP